jgi:hypothetical protein
MKINENKLPVKYALNIFKELDGYPTQTDFLYILLSGLSDQDEIENSFTLSKIWSFMKDVMSSKEELLNFLNFYSGNEECSMVIFSKMGLSKEKKPEESFRVIFNPWA